RARARRIEPYGPAPPAPGPSRRWRRRDSPVGMVYRRTGTAWQRRPGARPSGRAGMGRGTKEEIPGFFSVRIARLSPGWTGLGRVAAMMAYSRLSGQGISIGATGGSGRLPGVEAGGAPR